jgi:hypothetical protein
MQPTRNKPRAAACLAVSPRNPSEEETMFGTLYDDQLFADLYPPQGRPVEVAPWRLALVMVMQYIEGLTDRQAADAVRRCMDWKYALSLDLHDPGFDFTLLHDFRQRLLAHDSGLRLHSTRTRDRWLGKEMISLSPPPRRTVRTRHRVHGSSNRRTPRGALLL